MRPLSPADREPGPVSWPALLADALLAVHAAVVVFVVLGLGLIVLGGIAGWSWVRNPWFRLTHLLTIAVVAMQAWLGELCPLTVWEQDLRRAARQATYEGSFIEHWLSRLLYVDAAWWVFIAAYTVFAALVAFAWWRWPPRRLGRGD